MRRVYVPCVCVRAHVCVCVCLRVIRGEITINVTMSVDKDGILTVSIYSLFDYVFLAKDAECVKGSVQRRNVCTHTFVHSLHSFKGVTTELY